MDALKKISSLFLILMLALAPVSFANTVDISEDGTSEGRAREINVSTGLNVSRTGGTATLTLDQSGDLTFRTTLLANGRAGGASTLGSSSTQLSPSSLPYSVVFKKVGGGGGLDGNPGTTLQNGTPGQELSLIVTGLQSGGTWLITPTTKTGFSTITLDTVGDSVRLLYIDSTTGWVITSASGVIIAGTGTL